MIDLRSDTVTRPTPAMREAMSRAEVGDDVFGDDPSVNRLEEFAAELLGKAAALFVPSGTMANQIAIRLHTRPGDSLLSEAHAHLANYEAGGPAQLSGVTVRPVEGVGGQLTATLLEPHFPPEDPHFAPVTLVAAEDTANAGGGTVHPLEALDGVADLAHQRGARAHLDGARLFNAAVASGVSAARRAEGFDTLSVCLSKGLGAPVGSLLLGTREAIHRARRVRKAFGGGMRQAGFLAAAGLYALEHHVERLAEDHDRARQLATGLRELGFEAEEPATNLVYLTCPEAPARVETLREAGILCCAVGPERLRLVTHLDVDDAGVARTLEAFRQLRGDESP